MKKNRFFVPLLALLSACYHPAAPAASAYLPAASGPMEMSLHGDTRFSPEEREAFATAAEDWKVVTRGRVSFHVTWDLAPATLKEIGMSPRAVAVAPDDDRVTRLDAKLRDGAKIFAYTSTDRNHAGNVEIGVVRERTGAGWFYPVVLHELGHAAGLQDLPAGPWVMSISNPGSAFTAEDHEECARVFACR